MSWAENKGLGKRIQSLPLILCGPILRRVEPHTVSVFVALSHPREVTLTIYEGLSKSELSKKEGFEGTTRTVTVGRYLHVAVVTASISLFSEPLKFLIPGKLYGYDLTFTPFDQPDPDEPDAAQSDLAGQGLLTGELPLGYLKSALPSFSLPPADLNQLRIVHGSCRKPHAEGLDGMEALDIMIAASFSNANQRPHQLFLTGDQIYADDVADELLMALTDAGETLLGWQESAPVGIQLASFKAGQRKTPSETLAGFSSDDATSHLFSFAEYIAMYLFVWSDVLWPTDLPATFELPEFERVYGSLGPVSNQEVFETVLVSRGPRGSTLGNFNAQHKQALTDLQLFRSLIPRVRRALANVPTYMMLDDHEVTDDWYLNLAWCERVFNPSRPLGKIVLRNALSAYALFQGWGNTPERFIPEQAGDKLLKAISHWSGSQGSDVAAAAAMAHLVGLPATEPEAIQFVDDLRQRKQLTHRGQQPWHDSVDWHYKADGPKHEVIVLDTRTWRGYPEPAPLDFPALLGEDGFKEQIPDHRPLGVELTIVVSPAPVIGIPAIEDYQSRQRGEKDKRKHDAEAWSLQKVAFERLLARLAVRGSHTIAQSADNRVLILSGDVHYSFTTRLQYWSTHPFEQGTIHSTMVGAQLTSSAFKNETSSGFQATTKLHDDGFDIQKGFFMKKGAELVLSSKVGRRHATFFGWENPDQKKELIVGKCLVTYKSEVDVTSTTVDLKGAGPIVRVDTTADVPPRPDSTIFNLTLPHDWVYRTDYLSAEKGLGPNVHPDPVPVQSPSSEDRKEALKQYGAMATNHLSYLLFDSGKEIVGLNNLGEINFRWNADDDKAATHLIWWRQGSTDPDPFPLTRCIVSLSFNDSKYPQPQPPADPI